jgi:cytochrome P450
MLDEPGFKSEWVESVLSITDGLNFRVHFPKVIDCLMLITKLVPSLVPIAYTKLIDTCRGIVKGCIAADAEAKASGVPRKKPDTIIDAIINPPDVDSKGHYETAFEDLVEEAVAITSAGTDSTSNCLQYCTWHFLSKPEVRKKVLAELDTVERDKNGRLPLTKLEKLEYFVCPRL